MARRQIFSSRSFLKNRRRIGTRIGAALGLALRTTFGFGGQSHVTSIRAAIRQADVFFDATRYVAAASLTPLPLCDDGRDIAAIASGCMLAVMAVDIIACPFQCCTSSTACRADHRRLKCGSADEAWRRPIAEAVGRL